MLHIHFQSSFLQHTSLNNKELNNRWLVPSNTHILYVANIILNITPVAGKINIQLQKQNIFMCITKYEKQPSLNYKNERKNFLNTLNEI